MTKIAFLFPGQGSQKIGMGQPWIEAFPTAKHTFEEADDALGFHLTKLCAEGPQEELQLTTNTQPAILACSVAMLRVVQETDLKPVLLAGHSLGEYSALVAAGTLDFGDALRLVRDRGRFMQEAVPVGVGAMAAIMGLEADAVRTLAEEASTEDSVCAVANYNSLQQTVISGHQAAVERAVAAAQEVGAKKAVLLAVSAPFHSPLMAPARDALAPRLRETEFRQPETPVICNIDAEEVRTGDAARDALERQVDGPVRWVATMHQLERQEIDIAVEIGPGSVLSGLGRRTVKAIGWTPLPKPEALDKLLAKVS